MASILEQPIEKQLIRAQREGKTLAQWQADTSAPSSESRMLTPSEVKSLQQDKREAAEKHAISLSSADRKSVV